jgi:hypothetical protein
MDRKAEEEEAHGSAIRDDGRVPRHRAAISWGGDNEASRWAAGGQTHPLWDTSEAASAQPGLPGGA